MPVYAAKTKLKTEEVVEKALAYFGDGGLGLEIVEQSDCCVRFKGGGGHVDVYAELREDKTEIRIETREWDNQVKRFFEKL